MLYQSTPTRTLAKETICAPIYFSTLHKGTAFRLFGCVWQYVPDTFHDFGSKGRGAGVFLRSAGGAGSWSVERKVALEVGKHVLLYVLRG